MTEPQPDTHYDVAVIGAGPAGLSTAATLKQLGVEKVLVLDREPRAGGIPRHCGHPAFGMMEYFRPMTGPVYAERLCRTAQRAGADLLLGASVTRLDPGGDIRVATTRGMTRIKARRVVLATGARETPRSARLISGGRPRGITTTGALQSMVYLKGIRPFCRPVIVGSEIVSFSALLTCKKAGIKPAAMIEAKPFPSIPRPLHLVPALFGVPFYLNAPIVTIGGKERVEGITVQTRGIIREIPCDGVVFTGEFTPESALARMGGLKMDPGSGSPATDRLERCSDPAYYAVGNLLPPLNMAMNCWRAGRKTARNILRDLRR